MYTSGEEEQRDACDTVHRWQRKREDFSYVKIKHVEVYNSKKPSKTLQLYSNKGPSRQFNPIGPLYFLRPRTWPSMTFLANSMDLGVKGLILTHISNLMIMWKVMSHMGIISPFPLGLHWFSRGGCTLVPFLQLIFQFVPTKISLYFSINSVELPSTPIPQYSQIL